jgi:hypothetical protein
MDFFVVLKKKITLSFFFSFALDSENIVQIFDRVYFFQNGSLYLIENNALINHEFYCLVVVYDNEHPLKFVGRPLICRPGELFFYFSYILYSLQNELFLVSCFLVFFLQEIKKKNSFFLKKLKF